MTTEPATPDMLLMDFLVLHYLPARGRHYKRPLNQRTLSCYRKEISRIKKALGRPPLVADLQAETLASTVKYCRETLLIADKSVKHFREFFIWIWRFAADLGVVPIDGRYARKPHRAKARVW